MNILVKIVTTVFVVNVVALAVPTYTYVTTVASASAFATVT
jgi:hypothetical protein